MLLSTLIVRVAIPTGAVVVAARAQDSSFGLFHQVELPAVTAIVLAVVALDFIIYLQHLIFHHVPFLWSLHRVHHSDRDFDATTALRFHPVEILISLFVKFGAVYLLGVPPVSVIFFEVLLNGSAMFNHANAALPPGLDKWVRLLLVTPDMHRVHHSTVVAETNSNYGFSLPWWDRIFGTYRAEPQIGRSDVVIGLSEHQGASVGAVDLLLLPITAKAPPTP
ncbi:MAG: sterol desaturase family protein [Kofleriaceae bacterium]|nr:sterol desaturase family protein [Kofleriaceae bacterium]